MTSVFHLRAINHTFYVFSLFTSWNIISFPLTSSILFQDFIIIYISQPFLPYHFSSPKSIFNIWLNPGLAGDYILPRTFSDASLTISDDEHKCENWSNFLRNFMLYHLQHTMSIICNLLMYYTFNFVWWFILQS